MIALFQVLCESLPLATLLLVVAAFALRSRMTPARTYQCILASAALAVLAPVLVVWLPKWRILPAEELVWLGKRVSHHWQEDFQLRPMGYDSWFYLLCVLWALGLVWRIGSVLRQLWTLRRLWKKSRALSREVSGMVLRTLVAQGLRRKVEVRLHENQSQALTWGVWRPKILLPADVDRLSLADAKMILEHELGHVRRFDSLANWVLQILCTLYWFHPLSWWLMRRSQLCKELACDDLLLLSGIDASRYAACLGEATLRVQSDVVVPQWVSSFTRPHPALVRLHAILDERRQRSKLTLIDFWRVSAPIGMMSVFVASLGVKVAAEAQPQVTALLKKRDGKPTASLWSDVLVPLAHSNRVHEALSAIKVMAPSPRDLSASQLSQLSPVSTGRNSQASTAEIVLPDALVSSSGSVAVSKEDRVDTGEVVDADQYLTRKNDRSESSAEHSAEVPVRGVFASQRVTIPSNRGAASLIVDAGRGSDSSKVANRPKLGPATSSATTAKPNTDLAARTGADLKTPEKNTVENISGVTPGIHSPAMLALPEVEARSDGGQVEPNRQSVPVVATGGGANLPAAAAQPEVLSVIDPADNVSDDIIIPMMETVMGPRGPHRIAELELPMIAGKNWRIETSIDAKMWTDSPQAIAVEARPDVSESKVEVKAMVMSSVMEAPYEFLRIRSEPSEIEVPKSDLRGRNSPRPRGSEK